MKGRILEGKDLRLIRTLSLSPRRRTSGFAAGEQRSPVSGGGIEFAEYREYHPGDDLRRLDWSVFLRLGKLLVKVAAEEKELALIVILDASRSMFFQAGEKFMTAKRLACALSGIALQSGDRAGISVVGPSLLEPLRPERSKVSLVEVVRVAETIGKVDGPNPASCMRQFSARYGRKCMAVFLSDLLFPEWQKTLSELAGSGAEAYVVQILAEDEIAPPLYGETTFVDMEDGSEAPLYLDAQALGRYEREMNGFLAMTRAECARLGLGYALAPSGEGLGSLLSGRLRKAGLLC